MKVICTYTNHPQIDAAKALEQFAPETEYCQTIGLYGYCDVIESHWTGQDDLVVVEGDKVITANTLPSFAACDQPWCGCRASMPMYRHQIGLQMVDVITPMGIGCTKFAAILQRIIPTDEFLHGDSDFGPVCPYCDGVGCWNYLDLRMARAINARGITLHPHGLIEHKHEIPVVNSIDEITDVKWRHEVEYMESLAGPEWPYRKGE